MSTEDRLRQAIDARASQVEPSADALSRIEEKLMDAQRSDNRKRVFLGLGAAAAVVAIVIGAIGQLGRASLRAVLHGHEAGVAAGRGHIHRDHLLVREPLQIVWPPSLRSRS